MGAAKQMRVFSYEICGGVIASFLQLFICDLAVSAPPVQGQIDVQEQADFILAGIKSEREKLQSGRVAISGKQRSLDGSVVSKDESAEFTISLTFADAMARARYDIEWEGYGKGVFLKLPDAIVEWPNTGAGLVDVSSPTSRTVMFVRLVDPRCAGMLSLYTINKNILWEQSYLALEEWVHHAVSVRERADGITDIVAIRETRPGELETQCSLQVSESRGFSIERYEFRERDPGGDWTAPILAASAKWTQISGVWVPIRHDVTETTGNYAIEIDFDWKSVNSAIDGSEFDVQKIGAPRGTMIVEHRKDRPFIFGKIGFSPNDLSIPSEPGVGRRWIWVSLNIVAIMIILAVIAHRRWAKRSSATGSVVHNG